MADRLSGKDQYQCFHIKNTSTEIVRNFLWWLTHTKPTNETVWKWAQDAAGLNGTAQTIANINTAPTSVSWNTVGAKPTTPMITIFNPNDTFPIWVWRHANAVTISEENFSVADDPAIFGLEFNISSTGTGDTGGGGSGGSGGGTGGNPPPTPTDWKMAIAGDWGCGSTTNKVHDLAKTYDFILGVGDNAYASASCWTSTFSDVKSKMNSCYGNHEYEESGGIAPYKTFFGHDKTYFSFDFQNVHVVVCDSNINMDAGSAQNDFVIADLTAADNNPNIDWIFATMHHPWFGASSKHSYNNRNEVQAFHSLFQSHKVAFVFTGHNHNFQMSKQVAYNAGSPTNPTVFSGTAPFVKTSSGLIHIVSGTGGHDSGGGLYALSSTPSFQFYQNRTNNGIFEIVASNSGQTLTCSFVNTDGVKFNTFVITTS